MLVSTIYSSLSLIILILKANHACNENNDEEVSAAQKSIDYFSNNHYGSLFKPWPFNFYYEHINPLDRVDDEIKNQALGYFDHGRATLNDGTLFRFHHPHYGFSQSSSAMQNWDEGRSLARNNYFASPLIRFDPFQTTHLPYEPESRILSSLTNPFNNLGLKTRFSALTSGISSWLDGVACTTNNAESGICTNSRVCSNNGGRSGGSCSGSLGNVCCINTVTQCGATVTLNNTYWQSPTIINSDSTCYVSIRLDTTPIAKSICQIRLDFDAFSIAQPNTQTLCNVDNFRVNGAANKVPTICGQNNGQHMYLAASTPASNIQLIFSFGAGVSQYRNWKIRISMLSCSSTNILAPDDCLQYFTQSTGAVMSFNWREASPAATAPRQLANQDYNICFRTEQISSANNFLKASSSICFTPCVITTLTLPLITPLAFSLTGDSTSPLRIAGAGAGANPPQCANADYLIIDSAADPALPVNFNDRFCGNELNAQVVPVATTSTTLCTTVKPFSILYRTDGSEATTEVANNGFCLRFEQRA